MARANLYIIVFGLLNPIILVHMKFYTYVLFIYFLYKYLVPRTNAADSVW